MLSSTFLVVFLAIFASAFSFRSASSAFRRRLTMSTADESTEGYGPIGSLLRQGPVPFLIRITNPSTYDQAVNKYMNIEKCDKLTAQANMDAYFQDPNGWASNKMKSRKTGKDINYNQVNMDVKSLVLTAIWAVGISTLFYRIIAVQVYHQI